MREIRFRAWDGRNMEYFTLKDLWVTGCEQQLAELEDTKHLSLNSDYPYASQEIMQYTGLKDKSAKEIYESDIITDALGYKRTVSYEEHGFWCKHPNGQNHMPSISYREIIGNIYENPELLTE